MQFFEDFETETGLGFWTYECEWLRLDMLTAREKTTLVALCNDLRDYMDENWDVMHDYKNSMRRIQQLGGYVEDTKSAERTENKYNLFYASFMKKLSKIQIMLTTKKWIPYDFIFVDFVTMVNTFIPVYADWLETVIHLIFMDYTKYKSEADVNDHTLVVFKSINQEDTKRNEERITKYEYFNLLTAASPCVN